MYIMKKVIASRFRLIAVLLLTAMGLTAWLAPTQSPAPGADDRKQTEVSVDPGSADSQSVPHRTIATEWQWNEFREDDEPPTDTKSPSSQSTALFDVSVIYEALQEVRVDESGNVVVDDTALKALDEALDYGDLELTATDLDELRNLIRLGLPGDAGEQTAKIVGDYYQLLEAKKEFDAVYEAPGNERNYEAEYEELVALRELYLGSEVATKLFAETDKDARYMLESMRLAADTSLSPEERTEQQRALAASHHQTASDIPNWERRSAAFEEQKQHILNAGLTEEEEQQQIDQLLRQHFSEDEIASAGLLDESQDN